MTVDLMRYEDDVILQTLMHYDCDYLSICSLFIHLFIYLCTALSLQLFFHHSIVILSSIHSLYLSVFTSSLPPPIFLSISFIHLSSPYIYSLIHQTIYKYLPIYKYQSIYLSICNDFNNIKVLLHYHHMAWEQSLYSLLIRLIRRAKE